MEDTRYEDTPEELIIRHLDGYASPTEEEALKDWLSDSSKNREVYKEMKEIWEEAGNAAVLSDLDVEADWTKVRSKIQPKTSRVRTIVRRRWNIAAAIVLLIASGSIYLYFAHPGSGIQTITLQDGSQVWLAPGSKLEYSGIFKEDRREVVLTGKAYFEVAHNPAHPFTISAGDARIVVLGTSFNVIAEPGGIEVVVRSGKVQLLAGTDPANQAVLEKGQKGILAPDQAVRTQVNENPNYLSWKTNVLIFDGVPVNQALAVISDHYGTKLTPTGDADLNCQLSATFDNDKLRDVVEIIENSCQIQVQPWTD